MTETRFSDNIIVNKDYLKSEKEKCADLCFIPTEYLEKYIELAEDIKEVDYDQFKIVKGFLKIENQSSFSNISSLIYSYSSTLLISDTIVSEVKCLKFVIKLIGSKLTIVDSKFKNL